MLPLFSSASALPENFHNTRFCRRAAQERPLRAAMQHPTPKKTWSHRRTRPAVVFLDGKQWCCTTCLDINYGKSASALLQLLEPGEQQMSDLNLLCHSGWNEFLDLGSAIKQTREYANKTWKRESYMQTDMSVSVRPLSLVYTGVSSMAVMPELNMDHKVPVACLFTFSQNFCGGI